MAATDKAIMPAVEPTKILTMPPTMSTKAPTNNHLPMPDKSRLMTLAKTDMTANTPAVPPKAVMIRSGPFLKPKTMAIMRDSMRPMKNVKASKTNTPVEECLVFSMAYIKPMAPPKNTMKPKPPPKDWVMPVVTPSHAPSTVGKRLRASNM